MERELVMVPAPAIILPAICRVPPESHKVSFHFKTAINISEETTKSRAMVVWFSFILKKNAFL